MNYIAIETEAYPVTEKDIRHAFPNVSFGTPFVPPEGYAPVLAKVRPPHNMYTQRVIEGAPVLADGKWTQRWIVQDIPADILEKRLVSAKADAIKKIYADVDNIYNAAQGSRAVEYKFAEDEATDYIRSGFRLPVPACVSEWATLKEVTNEIAAQSIVDTATAWKRDVMLIRTTRHTRKAEIEKATSLKQVADSISIWNVFVTDVKTRLKL